MKVTTGIKYLALLGNAGYILWIIIRGLQDGFRVTPTEVASYCILLFLLAINIYILVAKE